MVYTVSDPYNGNIFGRLGKGIGQGISEQLPKEIQNRREANALQKAGESTNPLDQLSNLRKAGVSFGEAKEVLPYIRNQNVRNKFVEENRREDKPIKSGEKISRPEKDKFSWAPKHETESYLNSLQAEPDRQEINDLAVKYLDVDPLETREGAQEKALNEIRQNRGSQQTNINKFVSDFDQRFANSLQKGGIGQNFGDVAGEIQNALLDQGKRWVGLGMSPEAAASKVDDIALQLGKTANTVKELGSWGNMFRKARNKTADLKVQRKEFEKYGLGRIFDNLAASSLGISRMQAAHVLDPINNPVIEKELDKHKDTIKPGSHYKVKDIPNSEMKKIVDNIRPEDNIHDIQYRLREKGISLNQFKNAMMDRYDLLTETQRDQIRAPVRQDFAGDVLFQSFW